MSTPGRHTPVRVIIESTGTLTTLEDWMYWVEQEIRTHTAALNELGQRTERQSAQLRAELTAAQAELQETRALAQQPQPGAAALVHRIEDIDHRLNKVLALFTERLGGGQTEEGMLHHAHASEFVSLIEQGILALTRDYFQAVSGGSARNKAEFASHVCQALFADPEVQEHRLVDGLCQDGAAAAAPRARQLCADARTLRGNAAKGRPQRWEFRCTEGAPLNPDKQLAWTGSDEDGVVAFVVAPAYVVDADTVLEKQRVFTVPATELAGQIGTRAEERAAGARVR
jgi:hypothetical protein